MKKSFEKYKLWKYLGWTFGLAYLIQAGAALLAKNGNALLAKLAVALMMFVPALGAVLAGVEQKDMGWNPRFRKNIKAILFAWFAPLVLSGLGAGLYFLLFPTHFDLSGAVLRASGGGEALRQMEAQGLTYPMYVLLSVLGSVTYAPLINTFLALGEEIGWRGFLYPQLKARFGRRRGQILGGLIWGAWHWPLIWLLGYEYGAAAGNAAGYWGEPASGMLLFCLFTLCLGVLHDRLYERSGSIWIPALLHGAVNAAATLPQAVCLPDTGSARLLGPAPTGLLAGLPLLALALVVLLRRERVPDA